MKMKTFWEHGCGLFNPLLLLSLSFSYGIVKHKYS